MENKPDYIKIGLIVLGAILIVLLGIGVGFGVSKIKGGGTSKTTQEIVKTDTQEGVKDASNFPDNATGEIKVNDGKLTGEGSHVLVRPGGVSQNVYLTSSVVDMDKYVGKKVQIFGQTFKGQKAGWLMDVGLVKIVNE